MDAKEFFKSKLGVDSINNGFAGLKITHLDTSFDLFELMEEYSKLKNKGNTLKKFEYWGEIYDFIGFGGATSEFRGNITLPQPRTVYHFIVKTYNGEIDVVKVEQDDLHKIEIIE